MSAIRAGGSALLASKASPSRLPWPRLGGPRWVRHHRSQSPHELRALPRHDWGVPFDDHAGASPVSSVAPASSSTSRRLVVSTQPGSMSQPRKRRPSRQPRPRPSPPGGGACCEPAVVLCGPTREHRGSAGHQVDHINRGRGSCVCGWKAERETKRSRLHPPRQDDSFVSRSAFPAQGLLTIRCEVREPLLRLQDGTKPSSTTPTTRL
jgi:hypothetical protein